MEKLKLAVVVGSVRPNRFADKPAQWIAKLASAYSDFAVEIVDLKDFPLPWFQEKASPAYAEPENVIAKKWQAKVGGFDAYILISPEYNRGPTGVLKNALDHAYRQWNDKPVAFVGYGGVGGARSIEQLRLTAIELQMAPVRTAVHIQAPVYLAVLNEGKSLNDFDFLAQSAQEMLGQLVRWGRALKPVQRSNAA